MYDDPLTGNTYILLFNESLYYGSKMDHSLFNPNQLRKYGVNVWDNPFDLEHPFSIQVNDDVEIPLNSMGTKIFFKSRVPTEYEMQACPKIEVTSAAPWNPTSVELQAIKTSKSYKDEVNCHNVNDQYDYCEQMPESGMMLGEITTIPLLDEKKMINYYDQDLEDVPRVRMYVSTERHNKVSADTLSELLDIGPQKAAQTLRATRQRGVRSAILPIGRRYREDRMYPKFKFNHY